LRELNAGNFVAVVGKRKIKVLGIAGSPRRGGNTDLLLQEAMAGASSGAAETKIIILSELCIAPCRHCDGCLKTGKCVIEDDMQWIYTELRGLDHLVLASPIFFMGVTAQTKAMIDRCQALWVLKYILKLPVATNNGRERQGLFISVGGTELSNLFQPAIATIKSLFKTLDITYTDALLVPCIDEKGAITRHPTALRDAFLAGRKLVSN
jgi:multimeric flavodoxin WrbA